MPPGYLEQPKVRVLRGWIRIYITANANRYARNGFRAQRSGGVIVRGYTTAEWTFQAEMELKCWIDVVKGPA
jgi:hypothetical protein